MKNDQSRLVRIDAGPMKNPVPGKPRRPISGDAAFRTVTAFEGNGGRAEAGVWESTAGSFQSNTTGYIEFGYIVDGAARLVDPDGTVHELSVGEAFVMPEGYTGRWEVDSFVKKIYFISRTA
ncbi:cupin domain-containing protein [Achromobacter aegrifaciens]